MRDFTPECYVLVYDVVIMETEMRLDVVHMVGYPSIPSIDDLKQLKSELESDPEFEYLSKSKYSMMFCNSGILMDCISNSFDEAMP